VLIIVLAFVLVSIHPPILFFAGFLAYAASGPLFTLAQLRKRRAARKGQSASQAKDDS